MELVSLGLEALQTAAEHAASYRFGQSVLRQLDRTLWVVEKCARWAVPPPLDQDERPPPALVRPLPWPLFLMMLVTLRVIRESISLANLVMGKPPLRSADVVVFIQSRRRYIRTLKYQGNRMMRARTSAQPQQPWYHSLQSLCQLTMCFRRESHCGNNNTTRPTDNDEVVVVKRNKRGRQESPAVSSGETTMERLIEKMMVDLDAESDEDNNIALANASGRDERSECTESDQDAMCQTSTPIQARDTEISQTNGEEIHFSPKKNRNSSSTPERQEKGASSTSEKQEKSASSRPEKQEKGASSTSDKQEKSASSRPEKQEKGASSTSEEQEKSASSRPEKQEKGASSTSYKREKSASSRPEKQKKGASSTSEKQEKSASSRPEKQEKSASSTPENQNHDVSNNHTIENNQTLQISYVEADSYKTITENSPKNNDEKRKLEQNVPETIAGNSHVNDANSGEKFEDAKSCEDAALPPPSEDEILSPKQESENFIKIETATNSRRLAKKDHKIANGRTVKSVPSKKKGVYYQQKGNSNEALPQRMQPSSSSL